MRSSIMPRNKGQNYYDIQMPIATHRQRTTCKEFNCIQYTNGFKVVVKNDSVQAKYIREVMNRGEPKENRRHFIERKSETDKTFVEFIFPPGQRCFRNHSEPTGRPANFELQHGTGKLYRVRPESWRDDMNETLEKIDTVRKRELGV